MDDRILHLFRMCNYNVYQREADASLARKTYARRMLLIGAHPDVVRVSVQMGDEARARLKRHDLAVPEDIEKD